MIYDYETGGVNGFCRFIDSERFGKSFQYTASAEDAAEQLQLKKDPNLAAILNIR